MNDDIIIREIKEIDIANIVEIEKEAFTTPWSQDAFMKEINQNALAKYLVAELDGEVIGYGGIWFIINGGHITNIAVKKEYQGQGIGSSIIEGLIAICYVNDIQFMSLEVRKSNIEAQKLYKKYGFIEDGIKEEYYGDDGEDAIVMKRDNRRIR